MLVIIVSDVAVAAVAVVARCGGCAGPAGLSRCRAPPACPLETPTARQSKRKATTTVTTTIKVRKCLISPGKLKEDQVGVEGIMIDHFFMSYNPDQATGYGDAWTQPQIIRDRRAPMTTE